LIGAKKPAPDRLAAALESGAEVVKGIYRSAAHATKVPVDVRADNGSELPNYDLIVPALLAGGVEGLKESCKLTPGKLNGFGNRGAIRGQR
jgi:DNA ligase-1